MTQIADDMPERTRTPMKWQKVGLVVRPDPSLWWAQSHAMVPTPEMLPGGQVKIWFSGRDEHGRSHIGYAILDLDRPDRVLDYCSEPVLAPGALGCFDDNGVSPSCVVDIGGRKFLYYIGWNPGSTVRVHLFGGLAISDDGGRSFSRWSQAPILERNRANPFLNTGPWVVADRDGWRMYYVAGVGWIHKDLPRYNIQTATSADGMHWDRRGDVAIDFADDRENALARPYVVHEDGLWRMWFSHKGAAYRMGYAESPDGVAWIRHDDRAGITVSEDGFDSEMIEYAAVVTHEDRRFMFYNGNNYGYDGIGLAVQA